MDRYMLRNEETQGWVSDYAHYGLASARLAAEGVRYQPTDTRWGIYRVDVRSEHANDPIVIGGPLAVYRSAA